MNDKENQIKEMANIIADCRFTDPESEAIDLYNAKCRIIPEDSVLLTKEELHELKKYKTDWLNSEKMHLQGELEYTEFELNCTNEMYNTLSKLYDEAEEKLKKYNEFNNNLIVENQKLKNKLTIARKETAKEFAEKLKERCHNYYPSIDHYCCSVKAINVKDINELLKEYEK